MDREELMRLASEALAEAGDKPIAAANRVFRATEKRVPLNECIRAVLYIYKKLHPINQPDPYRIRLKDGSYGYSELAPAGDTEEPPAN
jgi:hypothetical protein